MKILTCVLLFLSAAMQASAFAQSDRIVDRAKRATVFVDLGDRSGSGFCFNGSGLFLTNQHVVASRKPGDLVHVVLNAGEKNERITDGRILCWDERVDLAVIRVDLDHNITPLPFGNPGLLRETDPVTAVGFPFGRLLGTDGERYPAHSVNRGQISALRRDGDQLVALQCDAAVNPGNSGGPLLNAKGETVGVVVAANPAARITIAIAVQPIREFLQKPAILLDVPSVEYGTRDQQQRINVEVVELAPGTAADEVELRISGATPHRKRLENGKATIETPLILRGAEAMRLQLLQIQDDTTKVVDVDDQPIRIGDMKLNLREVRSIEPRESIDIVTTTTGKKYAGAISGLADLKWKDGQPIDLKKFGRLDVYGVGDIDRSVTVDVAAKRKGKEVSSFAREIKFAGAPQTVQSNPYSPRDPQARRIDDLTVEFAIDGRDDILITAGGLFLRHHSFAKPGLSDDKGRYALVNGMRWDLKWEKTPADSSARDQTQIYPLNVGFDNWTVEVLSVKEPGGAENPGRLRHKIVQEPWGVTVELDDPANGAAAVKLRLKRAALN